MSLTITDLTPSFIESFRADDGLPIDQQRTAWAALLATPAWRAVLPAIERHLAHGDLDAALRRYPRHLDRIAEAAALVIERAEVVFERVMARLRPPDFDQRLVVLVSLFGPDGWQVWHEGTPACCVAVDSLEHPGQVPLLLAHEFAHAAHGAAEPDHLNGFATVGQALGVEGIALATTAALFPETGIGANCWLGRRRTVTGQPVEEWAADCERAWDPILTGLRRDFGSESDEDYARYFLGGDGDARLPLRCGYYAAQRLLDSRMARIASTDLTRMSLDELSEIIHTHL